MTRNRWMLLFISIITAAAVLIDLPTINLPYLNQEIGGYGPPVRTGLDIQGGTRVTLAADMSNISQDQRDQALQSAKEVINRRVDAFGVTEPNIYTSVSGDQYRINVELPGVTDTQEAISLIGQTAQLSFRELAEQRGTESNAEENADVTPTPVPIFFELTDLTGKDLQRAQVVFDPQSGDPVVQLNFNDEGAKKFAAITERNVGQPLAIFLDNQIVTAPRVNQKITGGEAVITGDFTIDEARQLAIQLNAGALPVPVEVVQQQNIGPTLGQQSVQKSVRAGVVGLTLVALFMIAIYSTLGVLAVVGLIIYGIITLALYRLIPVTLTLSGVAGFLLSVGMAVDANILIFERMKEELAAGKKRSVAMELGFGRAWDSIRDANVATLMTVFILFNPFNWSFLVTSGMVRGFALTLGLGVLISLFTGVIVTRTLVRLFYS